MTFYHSNDVIMNQIHFDENGIAMENYDMHGMEIVATSDNWQPFTKHSACDENGRNCENSGLLIDKMEIWCQKFNFTWDIKTYKGDWGMFPKSGDAKTIYSLVIYPLEWRHFFEWRHSVENGAILVSKSH